MSKTRNTITIPTTPEEAVARFTELDALPPTSQREWEKAAIIAALVKPDSEVQR